MALPEKEQQLKLENQFYENTEKYPGWSSYLCFAEAIKHRRYNKKIIFRMFTKLVNPDDYNKSEKEAIIEYLENLSLSHR